MPALASISFIFTEHLKIQTPIKWYTLKNTDYVDQEKTIWHTKNSTEWEDDNGIT